MKSKTTIDATKRKSAFAFRKVPKNEWPAGDYTLPDSLYLSGKYLVQVYSEHDGIIRLSICERKTNTTGGWKGVISWDALNSIKSALGYGDSYGVEVFPKQQDIVNVANMRHLWILPEPLDIGWVAQRENHD